MKTGRNDPCPCGSGEKYKKCCLNKQANKVTTGELPLYRVLISEPKGSRSVVIARERPDGNLQFVSVLIDEWKMGLKDCFGSRNLSKKRFDEIIRQMPIDYINADLDECNWLIKQGLRIAKAVGARIPGEFYKLKDIIGGLDDIHITGSLYKCYKCGKGELSDEDVGYIKKVTYHDMARGVCGTPGETKIFVVCDACKKSGDKSLDETDDEIEEEIYDEYYEDEEYKTRENYLEEARKSLRKMSGDECNDIKKNEGWDTWDPVVCMSCNNEENFSVKYFAVKGDLEPGTIEEENMLFKAVKEFSKISDLGRDDVEYMLLGDYFIIDIPTCSKCGSHNIFSDF